MVQVTAKRVCARRRDPREQLAADRRARQANLVQPACLRFTVQKSNKRLGTELDAVKRRNTASTLRVLGQTYCGSRLQ